MRPRCPTHPQSAPNYVSEGAFAGYEDDDEEEEETDDDEEPDYRDVLEDLVRAQRRLRTPDSPAT